jgi:hypothetical protein
MRTLEVHPKTTSPGSKLASFVVSSSSDLETIYLPSTENLKFLSIQRCRNLNNIENPDVISEMKQLEQIHVDGNKMRSLPRQVLNLSQKKGGSIKKITIKENFIQKGNEKDNTAGIEDLISEFGEDIVVVSKNENNLNMLSAKRARSTDEARESKRIRTN